MKRPIQAILHGCAITATTAAATLGLGSSPARANVTAAYINDTLFTYKVTGMPDLDQRRKAGNGGFGLPGDGGMYCVPTSSMNLICYLSNHGFPFLLPNNGNWQSQSLYNAAGINIWGLGNWMGTDAAAGTGGQGWYDGLSNEVAPAGGLLTVNTYFASSSFFPTFPRMAKTAIEGSLVAFAYGRYDTIGTYLGVPLISRTGGHIITLDRALASGSNRILRVRDPADDSADYYGQSLFVDRDLKFVQEKVVAVDPSIGGLRLLTEIGDTPNTPTNRFIDGYVGVRCLFGYGFLNAFDFVIYQPIQVLGTPQPAVSTFTAPDDAMLLDVMIDPDLVGYFVLTQHSPPDRCKLWKFDPATGNFNHLIDLSQSAKKFIVGRNRFLYVIDGTTLKKFNFLVNPPLQGTAELPFACDDLAYDDQNDIVEVISLSQHKLIRYPASLAPGEAPPPPLTIPSSVPLGSTGHIAFGVNTPTPDTWLVSSASNMVFKLALNPFTGGITPTGFNMPGVTNPQGIDVSDAGHLFISANNAIVELMPGNSGGWVPVPGSAFGGKAVSSLLRITHSRTNFDPATMSGPAFNNIPPAELTFAQAIPDCDADIAPAGGNGVVNVDDLLAIINAWGTNNLVMDIAPPGGNGIVNVDDLLAVINTWGPCP